MCTYSDNDIRVVLIADNSKIVSLQGHTTSLKSIDYDPTGEYIASSSCDGDIRIWSVGPNEPAPRCVKVLKNITPASKPDHALTAKVLWSPDKSCFAFPGKNNDIRMFTYGLWTPYSTLENGHTEVNKEKNDKSKNAVKMFIMCGRQLVLLAGLLMVTIWQLHLKINC